MANKYEARVYGDSVEFTMRIKRDSFAPEHVILVTIDVSAMTREQMLKYCFSGATLRVKLQSQLRGKTEVQLSGYAKDGYKTTFEKIDEGSTTSLGDRLMKLTKPEFIAFMLENFGMPEDEAIIVFRRKHGLETPDEE